MKEFLNSLLEVGKERIRNPLIGSFIFAWLVFNWKPILYLLFSNDIMSDKISTIECKYINIWDNLGLPFVFAVLYIVVLPYIMWGLEELYIKAKSGRLSNKLNEELLNIRNKQETTRESLKLENIKADFKETSELNEKIQSLEKEILSKTKTIKSKEVQNEGLSKEILDLNKEIKNLQEDVISFGERKVFDNDFSFFKDSEAFKFIRDIGAIVIKNVERNDIIIPNHILDKYELQNLIYPRTIGKGGVFYFTKKGQYFWNKFLTEDFIKSIENS